MLLSKTWIVVTGLKITKRLSRKKGDIVYKLYFAGLRKFYPKEKQFEAFDDVLWVDGFHYSGEVMDSNNAAADGHQGVTYHEIYVDAMKPFVTNETVALEIGPGRGNWTKGLMESKEVWTLDPKSLQNNKIMEYLENPDNLNYIQVQDYSCKELPEDHFDFLFSYGVFCHLPWDGIEQYMKNVYPKLREGAIGVISI